MRNEDDREENMPSEDLGRVSDLSESATSALDRRDFLHRTAGLLGGAAIASLTPLEAAARSLQVGRKGSKPKVLVVLYLRGGMDALGVICPFKDKRYYEIRPTIAIPEPHGKAGACGIALDDRFAMHPALAPLEGLWKEGRFVPLLSVGSPHPTRSHFDAQDFMEYAAPGNRTIRDGWLNRYLEATKKANKGDAALRAIALQGLLPRSLRGRYPVLAVPGGSAARTGALLDLFDDLYVDKDAQMGTRKAGKRGSAKAKMRGREEDAVLRSGRDTIRTLRRYQEIQERGARLATKARYTRGPVSKKLAGIARVIKAGEPLQVAAADWNGWDHHIQEGGLQGRMARMLAELGQSIAAFLEDLGPDAERTLVVTMSEFGRTCRENGNAGTDHGHGGLMLFAGAGLRGKRVHGRWKGLEDAALYQGRDLAVTTDFRDVMQEILTRHLGFKPPRGFFPDYKPGRRPKILA